MTSIQLNEMIEMLYENGIITIEEKTMFKDRLYEIMDCYYHIDMNRKIVYFIDRVNAITVSKSFSDVVGKISYMNKRIKNTVYYVDNQYIDVVTINNEVERMTIERFINEFITKEIQNSIVRHSIRKV